MMFEKLEEIAANEHEENEQFIHTIKVCVAAGCLESLDKKPVTS